MSEEEPLQLHDEIVHEPRPEEDIIVLPAMDFEELLTEYTSSPANAKKWAEELNRFTTIHEISIKELRKKIKEKLKERDIVSPSTISLYTPEFMKSTKRVEAMKVRQAAKKGTFTHTEIKTDILEKTGKIVEPEPSINNELYKAAAIAMGAVGDIATIDGKDVDISGVSFLQKVPTIQKLVLQKDSAILYSLYNACQEALNMKRPDVDLAIGDVFKGIVIEYDSNGVKEIYASWGPEQQ